MGAWDLTLYVNCNFSDPAVLVSLVTRAQGRCPGAGAGRHDHQQRVPSGEDKDDASV